MRRFYLILLIIIICYLFLRLCSLLTIPFFIDEADYIYFSKIIFAHPDQGLFSLYEGVKPMFMWLMIPFLAVSHGHDLIFGRMVPLLAGLATMMGIYLLSIELFKKKEIGILSMIVFLLSPYAQIYNVLAVLEGTVAMFIIFSLYFAIKLFKKPNFTYAYTFGILTALGILTKRHAFFSLYLLPFMLLFFDFTRPFYKRLLKLVLLILFAISLVVSLQLILHLSVYFERIAWFEGGPIYTKRAWLELPLGLKLTVFTTNITTILKILTNFLTIPYILLLAFSFTLLKKNWKQITVLFAYFIIPLLTLAIFGRGAGARWIYPMIPPLIPIIAFSLYELKIKLRKTFSKKYIYFFFLAYPAFYIFMILVSPLHSPLSQAEKDQYFTCPKELADVDFNYLHVVSKDQKVVIGTVNDLGFKNYLAIKLDSKKNIRVIGYFPKEGEVPKELEKYSAKTKTYFATYLENSAKLTSSVPIQLITEKKSPYKNCTYRLYKIGNT